MVDRNMEAHLARLLDPNSDTKVKYNVAVDLRDNIELWCQGSVYPSFLQNFIPVFLKLLDGQPVFVSTSPEQKLRLCVLEILHRLPMTPPEALEPYAAQIVDKLMSLVRVENEDNAVLCMKTIMDFLRHQTKALADRVTQFLDLIQELFEIMEQAVRDTFDDPPQSTSQTGPAATPSAQQYSQSPRPQSPVAPVSADVGGEQQPPRQLQKGMQSFKVLAECPIIVVSIFQAYRNVVHKYVRSFVPLIKGVLQLQAKPQERAHTEAKAQGTIFTGVSKDIKNRVAFGDFITAQVKTMSFLAYLLRVYSQQLMDFLPILPDIVIRLLKDCPREKSGARKELLVAIRHIINFNFRKIFLKKIDELLDERTLIGDGLTVYETMRPLAYSMLADLIHHLRESLTKEQIRRTIEVYTKNLHDDFPGTSFQTMSAKLLLNMAEYVAKLEPKTDARYYLIMILNAIGDKFAAMNRQFSNAIKVSASYSPPSIEIHAENYLADQSQPPDWDEIDIFNAAPIKTSNPRERSSDPIADNRFLFKNLLHGLKNLFYQLRACNPPRIKEELDSANVPPNWNDVSFGYNAEEVEILIKLFREGAQVFRYYGLENKSSATQQLSPSELLASQQMMNSGKEEKDLLEAFATVFHHIDPATFHEVFQSEIPHLYEMMFEHNALLHVPQFLLASEATSPSFAGMLLQFLMDRIEEVGTADTKKSSILLRLFKLSFMAVTLFSQQNEQVLLPHVTCIVTKSIQLSTTAEDPMNYFLLLRSLFRSIGGGRFEHLYKEILPLLEMLLEVLNNLLLAARKPSERDLFVELSLTVPARLSNLLPHLSYLMRPLVVALRAGSDLVGQGLRTLELCVDNLTADYLDPIMAPVIDELMAALWEHLKPNPYSHFHAHTTMRILGKLGGRNRKFLNATPELCYKPYADDTPSINIKLIGSTKNRAFPAPTGIELAIARLIEIPKTPAAKKSDGFYKQQAFKLIVTHTKLLIGFDNLPDDFAQLVRLQANDLCANKFDAGEEFMEISERDKSIAKRDAQQETLKSLLKACIHAVTVSDVKNEATAFMANLCRRFTILEVGKALAQGKHNRKPFDVNAGEGPVFIDSRVIADAIGESLASDEASVRAAAEDAIITMRDAAEVILGSPDKVDKLPFFVHLAKTFTHSCHAEEWFIKAGGTLGIDIMLNKLGLSDAWTTDRQIEFVRALMYVIKDVPQDITAKPRIKAEEALEIVIRRCNKNVSREDITRPQSKLYNLCGFMVYELAHMNKHVRLAAQKIFGIIAEVIGAEIHELILPVKDRLLVPIFNKPLRALPFGTQIGYIDAITFCLQLQHNILEFNDQLMRLLMESLALADADDETLATKPLEQRNVESIVQLRIACIRLLSTAQNFPEFGSSPPNQSRARIIAVFFKSLYHKSPDVVRAANAGLKGVLAANNKLPKDLLQSGLRPILMNLQDPRKLSVEGLEGLARLLKLLTNYFKVEIGTRLLDHMQNLTEHAVLQKISFTLVEQNKQMKVVTAILNVFHLLPPAAITFLSPLVRKVIELETALRRTHFSPFREPLIKYLNHYPKDTWEFFAPMLRDHSHGRFFAQLIADPASGPLREVIVEDVPGFLKAFTIENNDKERWPAVINAIHLTCSICKHPETKNWLVSHEDLRKTLLESAKALELKVKQNTINPDLRLAAQQAGEHIIVVLTTYLVQEPQDLEFFFEVVNAVTAEELKLSPVLVDFIYREMITSESIDYWRTVVMKSMDLYSGKSTSQKTKTFVFHNIVNPILAMDVMRNWDHLFGSAKGTKLVDKTMTEAILNKLWRPQSLPESSGETGQLGVDHSRMELLQTTALLLKYHTNLIQDHRKDVIRFGWNWVKLEDVINKHAAYVVVAYFIAHYETPVKITMQVYQALLKAHQNEGRSLVTQALELIAPVLEKRLAETDKKIPLWARMPKKILTEESSNLQQLMSIFNFLVRHPDLFYEAREALSLVIIPSLTKIAQPPSPSNESKKIALSLINLIRQWEHRAQQEASAAPDAQSNSPHSLKRQADGSQVVSSPGSKPRTFVANPALRIVLIKYLVQFIATLPERYPLSSAKVRESNPPHNTPPSQQAETCKKAVQLLHDLLSPSCWSDLDIEAMFPKITEQVLTSDPTSEDKPEAWATRVINTLQVVKIIVNVKPDEWVVNRVTQLQKLCEKPIRQDNVEIQECLHGTGEGDDGVAKLQPLIKRILDVIPEPASDEEGISEGTPAQEFIAFCGAVATEALSNGNLTCAINLLWTLCQRRPDEIDQHVPHLMKAFTTKLAKEHLAAYAIAPGQQAALRPGESANGAPPDAAELENQTGLILKVIDILAARINHLGDQRRPYLSALASLVERSQSNAVCMKILDLIEFWVFNVGEPVPTLKEKTAVLHKMLMFESRPDTTLLTRFLELVIRIYEDPKVTRSELTVRMEHAFLIGTRAQDVDMRNRFMAIFDKHLSRTASSRLKYVVASQDWSMLADTFWLSQVIQLMLGSVEMNAPAQLHEEDFTTVSASKLFGSYGKDQRLGDIMIDDKFEALMANHKRFCSQLRDIKVRDIMDPLGQLQHTDGSLARQIWVAFFPLCWSALLKDDRAELEKGLVALLTKDYHTRQIDKRPNCVQSMLEAIVCAKPRVRFPPHVMKFLAKTYNVWYIAADYMEEAAINPIIDTPAVRESNLDALLEIYAGLQEDDLFYGTWRRRCQYVETNAALSYEQNGVWDKAQSMYENAQIKARTGALPFSQGEYMLWEDHWVICAQKLQQWEILSDFAKHENFNDLYLEASWRNFEAWNNNEQREQLDSIIKSVSDAPTPRRVFFQAFMSLLKLHAKTETPQEFNRVCDEAVQLSIRKWHQLPKRVTNAHIPILQNFQNLVELHDASVICASLAQTNQANLETKSQELKMLLGTWRDRLPNFWDDINAWQDLVTWRQHIFQLINGVYLHLLPPQQGNATGSSFAYRGYHETAWIINRFAHVARKHNLPDVCIAQLGRIYTLPNIEIQEAFLKLREQAKCHYQNRAELNSGLDVINNTNLNYFGQQQKAEFYTLKGMFLNKLGQETEANDAFGSALYFDIKLPKAWAEWGHYNDMLFKKDPTNLEKAASAISCYLEAASQYKNAKSRKLLGRILWLLSLDDSEYTLAKTFEQFKGDTPIWYWITYIPQLLTSLSRPEAPIARQILGKIAKTYPQALFFQLRTSREDMHVVRKQQEAKEAREKAARAKQTPQGQTQQSQGSPDTKQTTPSSRPQTASGDAPMEAQIVTPGNAGAANVIPKVEQSEQAAHGAVIGTATAAATATPNGTAIAPPPATPKKPWDYTEEITSALKTAFPLLALSMETMVDQIQKHFKCPPDEDAHRLLVALLNDGLSYVGRQPGLYAQDVKLPQTTEANLTRFAESILPAHIRKSFEADFVSKKPTMHEYIQKLRKWRGRFEEKLDRRTPLHASLESYSAHLSEFKYQKFDEVEVPGQYLQHRDKNQDFVRIERFLPDIDLVRGFGVSHRRIKIRGHDGSTHVFAIQHPAARHCRREERILQLFRIFNGVLLKRKECRRRNLQFTLPLMVPLSPNVRMVQDDESYVTLQGIYEDYCRQTGGNKDEPILFTIDKLRALNPKNMQEANSIRLETFAAIQENMVPHDITLNYFRAVFPSFDDFWLFRRTFSYQLAALTFITYIMHMNTRYPHKLSIARGTGKVWGTELIPAMAAGKPFFHNPEPVPFRLTPNLQTLMGPLATEGIFAPAIMAIARCLTEPEGELEMQLSIFVRDEMTFWYTQQHRQNVLDGQLRESVQTNSEMIVKRAVSLAQPPQGASNLPANQTIVDLVSHAVNPQKLCQADPLWMAYL